LTGEHYAPEWHEEAREARPNTSAPPGPLPWWSIKAVGCYDIRSSYQRELESRYEVFPRAVRRFKITSGRDLPRSRAPQILPVAVATSNELRMAGRGGLSRRSNRSQELQFAMRGARGRPTEEGKPGRLQAGERSGRPKCTTRGSRRDGRRARGGGPLEGMSTTTLWPLTKSNRRLRQKSFGGPADAKRERRIASMT